MPPSFDTVDLENSSVVDMTMSNLESEDLVMQVRKIYGVLAQRSDLRPCKAVNELFGGLVGLCIQTLSEKTVNEVLQNIHIAQLAPSLRKLCSTAEYYLETYWANLIVQPEEEIEVEQNLRKFPYHGNYIDLTRMELGAIYAVRQAAPQKIAFIGSGPLPLTSLCLCQALHQRPNAMQSSFSAPMVLNIDNDHEAISQSRLLCSRLGPRARGMRFLCADANDPDILLQNFDVVYLAALVGQTTKEKERVLLNVASRMSPGALLIIRTAHSLRKLLYPEFDVASEMVKGCLEVCLVVHPYNHIVNSVIIGRVKERQKGSR